jgi:pimeloyl-ACP methyl ester carboxylesterase
MVRFIERNGVRLAFSDSGARASAETVIFIHGWGDRHELFDPMARLFRERYRTIAVDLRGHGRSDKPTQGYDVPTLADDVAAVAEQARAGRFHLVGHSLGGAVALDLAARYPARARSVSAIEGAFLFPPALTEGFKPLGDALRGPKWKEAMRGFIDSCYWPGDDPALRRYSYRELDRIPRHVHVGVYEGATRWDAGRAARAWRGPLLYVEGGSGLCDTDRLRALCPQLRVARTVGVSHMEIIGKPEQAAAMIRRFLGVYAGDAPRPAGA